MLNKLSARFGYNYSFFKNNILWYFISVFFFSRLFYVIGSWQDMKFIKDPFQFFISGEFNFSLFGAIFGFWLVLRILTKLEKSPIDKYIDGIVVSFLFVLVIGYIGAIFWGQVYGRETNMGIEILYQNSNSIVPYQVPVFPLPIVYAAVSFIIFCIVYILGLFVHIRALIGYIWLLAFSSMILVFESLSGKYDLLSLSTPFNFPQLCALFLALWSGYRIYVLYKRDMIHPTQTVDTIS